MNASKPTPVDEARDIIYFLRSVYEDAVGDLYADIKASRNSASRLTTGSRIGWGGRRIEPGR